jgi:hemin uptake protein HemP
MGVDSQNDPTSNHADATNETTVPTRSITVVAHKIDSRELFAGNREIIITHREDSYRLRLTAQNKLILTK